VGGEEDLKVNWGIPPNPRQGTAFPCTPASFVGKKIKVKGFGDTPNPPDKGIPCQSLLGSMDILKPALMLLPKFRLLHSFRIYVSGRRNDGSPGGVWEGEGVYIIDGHRFLKGVLRL